MRLYHRWILALVYWVSTGAQQEPGMGYPLTVFHLPPTASEQLVHQRHGVLKAPTPSSQLRPSMVHRMVNPEVTTHAQLHGDMHAALLNAALAIPIPPHDTPEVQVAREHHLQCVQEALLQHALAHDLLQHPQQQRPAVPLQPPIHGVVPSRNPVTTEVDGDGDSLVVESDGHVEPAMADEGESELTRYPDLQQVPQTLFDPSHVHDPDLEAVIVNALARARRARTLALSDGEKELVSVQDQSKSASSVRTYHTLWPNVPMYIEVKPVEDDIEGKSQLHQQENDSPSYSQKAVFAHAKTPAAVHSFQVPPSGRTEFTVTPLPLFLTPHDTLPLSYSAKANYFHSIPVAAVHDTQMHPNQVGRVMDHQQQPVFHEVPSEAQHWSRKTLIK